MISSKGLRKKVCKNVVSNKARKYAGKQLAKGTKKIGRKYSKQVGRNCAIMCAK